MYEHVCPICGYKSGTPGEKDAHHATHISQGRAAYLRQRYPNSWHEHVLAEFAAAVAQAALTNDNATLSGDARALRAELERGLAALGVVDELVAVLQGIADYDEIASGPTCIWCGGEMLPEGGIGYEHEDWCAVEYARAALAAVPPANEPASGQGS